MVGSPPPPAARSLASAPVWRHLALYDQTLVAARLPAHLPAAHIVAVATVQLDSAVLPAPAATAEATPGIATFTLLADIQGRVHVLDEGLTERACWLAYASGPTTRGRVTHIASDVKGRVVTLGEEDGVRFPLIRVWDLARRAQIPDAAADAAAASSYRPSLLTEGKVQHGSKPHPVASLAITPSLSFLSVGLADGTVLLMRNLDAVLAALPSNTPMPAVADDAVPPPLIALPKFKVVFQPGAAAGGSSGLGRSSTAAAAAVEPITGLGFSEELESVPRGEQHARSAAPTARPRRGNRARALERPGAASSKTAAPAPVPRAVHLFIVTLARTLRYTVAGPGAGSAPAVVDEIGCGLGCANVIPTQLPHVAVVAAAGVKGRHRGGAASRASLASHALRTPLAGKMVVSREEAIYVVGADGREVCLAYEGAKAATALAGTHLVIISPPFLPSAGSSSPTVRAHVAQRERERAAATPTPAHAAATGPASRRPSAATLEATKVTIFDLDNKVVAFSGLFDGDIRHAWTGPRGEVFCLCDDGALTRLDEKALRSQLDILFRKNLFLLAVNVARSHAARSPYPTAEDLLGDIYCRYADHLYARADFDGAVSQYVKSIGVTPASYVIRRFLDAQRIGNLTTYLQELHARGMANSDHTTLLLNCYTRLRDVDALDRFIKRPFRRRRGRGRGDGDDGAATGLSDAEDGDDDDGDGDGDNEDDDGVVTAERGEARAKRELPFDLDTAIRVCRQAGYLSHAAYLARRFGEHDEYLRIQLDDARDYGDALAYLRSLPLDDATRYMAVHARTFLDEMPAEATDFLVEICAGTFRPRPVAEGAGVVAADATKGASAAATYLSYLQVGNYSRGGTDRAAAADADAKPGEKGDPASATAAAAPPPVDVPPPRTFFAHFVRHPFLFLRFLESVALARWGQAIDVGLEPEDDEPPEPIPTHQLDLEASVARLDSDDVRDQKATWNTLLEVLLAVSRPEGGGGGGGGAAQPKPPAPPRRADDDAADAGFLRGPRTDAPERALLRLKALRLLQQHASLPYDATQALVQCELEGFEEGQMLLYERLGMYEDVLRLWMERSARRDDGDGDGGGEGEGEGEGGTAATATASDRVVRCLWRYAPRHDAQALFPLALRYLVSTPRLASRHRADVLAVLAHVERESILTAVEVVQLLGSAGSSASVGLVRDYMTRTIEAEKSEIEANDALISSYRGETAKKLSELAELSDASAPRVFQLTRCTACGLALDLPSVHFMCRHSYHQRCLGDDEAECAECARSHGVMREIRRNNEALGSRHDVFLQDVDDAEDGFETIAAMFSKGLFARPRVAEGASAA